MRISLAKMTRWHLMFGLLSSFALVGAPIAAASCSYCNCRSYNDYLPDHDGGICSTSSCSVRCAQSPTLAAWTPELTGIEVSDSAQPVVVVVYPNSPAAQAGIKPGDILLKINGRSLPYSCSSDDGSADEYLIKRGKQILKIVAARISATEMLLRASGAQFKNVSMKTSGRLRSLPPYISGALLHRTGYGFLVDQVIPGSPAEAVGLRRGMRVVGIVDALTNQPSNAGEGADYRAELRFIVTSGEATTTETLTLRGLSEILADISTQRSPSTVFAALKVAP